MVSINVDIYFKKAPKGSETDKLEDTVCYLKLTQEIIKYCKKHSFNFIEHLGKSVHNVIYEKASSNKALIQGITVEIHKLSPPVPQLQGGVKWTHHINYESVT